MGFKSFNFKSFDRDPARQDNDDDKDRKGRKRTYGEISSSNSSPGDYRGRKGRKRTHGQISS